MRFIVFALFLTICCIAVSANAAALTQHPSENPESAVAEGYNQITDEKGK